MYFGGDLDDVQAKKKILEYKHKLKRYFAKK